MITQTRLVQITESSIDSLLMAFKKRPYFFYTENDLHCHLYHEIYRKLPLESWLCETKDNKRSMLLHKEYPTKERYSAKNLKEGVSKGARGHFDLAIWNPEETGNRVFRVIKSTEFDKEQQTFIAIEFDLIEGNDSLDQALHHFKWDLLKLKSRKNQVEHGYSLVFVRDWIYSQEFLQQIKNEAARERDCIVLYAESKENQRLIGTLSLKPLRSLRRIY